MYILDQIEQKILSFINKQNIVSFFDLVKKFKGYIYIKEKLDLFEQLNLIEKIDVFECPINDVSYRITKIGQSVIEEKKVDYLGSIEIIIRIIVLVVIIAIIIVILTQ